MPRASITWQPFGWPEHLAARHLGLSATRFKELQAQGHLPEPDSEGVYGREALEEAYRAYKARDTRDGDALDRKLGGR